MMWAGPLRSSRVWDPVAYDQYGLFCGDWTTSASSGRADEQALRPNVGRLLASEEYRPTGVVVGPPLLSFDFFDR